MARGRRLGWGAALVVLLAGLAGVGLRLDQVHEYGWEWTLSPSEAPPKVRFQDRDYQREEKEPRVPDGWVRRGETLGGGDIFVPGEDTTPVVLSVRSDDGVWGYALMGGP